MSIAAGMPVLALSAYAIGSFPTAYLVVRWRRRVDIRTLHSGNVGAFNTYRAAGLLWALVVMALDTGKGALAVELPRLLQVEGDAGAFAASVAVVAGHNWPVFLGFRGGRGAATTFGLSLAMLPALTLASAAIGLALGTLTRNLMAGIIAGFLALDAMVCIAGQDAATVALCFLLTVIVGGTHVVGQRRAMLAAIKSGRWVNLLGVE